MRSREALWATAAFAWLAYYQWLPALIPPVVPIHHVTMPGNLADPRLLQVLLENGYQWMSGHASLFSPGFFFPLANAGALSDLLVGTLPFYAVWRLVGLDELASMQLWVWAAVAANYVAAYVVAKRFGLAWPAAIVAAVTFTFAPTMAASAPNMQTIWRPFVPFATYWAVAAATNGVAPLTSLGRRLLVIAGLLAYGFLCSPAMAVFTWLWVAIVFGAVAVSQALRGDEPRLRLPDGVPSVTSGVLAAVAVVSACVIAVWYAEASATFGLQRSFGAASGTPSPLNWLQSTTSLVWAPISQAWEPFARTGDWRLTGGGSLFPGLAITGLVAYGLWKGGGGARWVWVLAGATAVAIFIVTSSSHVSAFVLLSQLPGLNAVRAPGRIALVLLFPIGLLAGAAWSFVLAHASRRAIVLAGFLLAADLTLTVIPSATVEGWYAARDTLEPRVASLTTGITNPVLLYLPPPSAAEWTLSPEEGELTAEELEWNSYRQLDAMLTAQHMRIPTINGVSGFWPFTIPVDLTCAKIPAWVAALKADLPPGWPRVQRGPVTIVAVGETEACTVPATF